MLAWEANFRDDRVAGRARIRDHRSDLVGDLFRRYDQQVLFIRRDAVVAFVEVKEKGGEVGGFPAYVGAGPSDHFVDQQPPIHRPDSGHGAEQGVGHGQGNPLGLFRIEDGHEEFQHP